MRIALAGLLLAGCAAESSVGHWLDPAHLPRATGKEGYPAVVLYKSDRLVIYPSHGRFEYTEYRHHQAVQVLTEAGLKRAEVRVRHPKDAEVKELRARSLDPDGSVHELDPKAVLEEVAVEGSDMHWMVKAWRVPGAKVGSVIEWAYTIRYDHSVGEWSEYVADSIPVRQYDVEIEVGSRVRYALRTYNALSSFDKDHDGDFLRFRWGIKDVPAVEDDGFSPSWTVASPWWIYRTKQEVYGDNVYDYVNDWSDALSPWVAKLDPSSDLFDQASAPVGAGCAEAGCRVEAALEEVRKVPLRRSDGLREARKVSEILTSGWATTAEKGVLLLRALRAAGLQARPAFVTTQNSLRVDERFPWSDAWNRLLVLLPQQPGLERAIWIDPICETCRPGQIPPWTAGGRALVVRSDVKFDRNDEVPVDRLVVEGEVLPGTDHIAHYEVQVDAEGKATVTYDRESTGGEAMWERARSVLWTEEDWAKSSREWVSDRVATAHLREAQQPSCEPGRCRRHIVLDVSDYATVDGDRILVPLTVMRADWDGRFLDKERNSGIVVESSMRYQDEVVLRVPEGYDVTELPAPRHLEAPALTIDIDSRKEPGQVVIHRVLQQKVGSYERETYESDQAALRPYRELRHALVVLKKKP